MGSSPLSQACLASFGSSNALSSLQALVRLTFCWEGSLLPVTPGHPSGEPRSAHPPAFPSQPLLPLGMILFLCILVCGPPPWWGWGLHGGAGTLSVLAGCVPSTSHGTWHVVGVWSLLEEGMMSKGLSTLPRAEALCSCCLGFVLTLCTRAGGTVHTLLPGAAVPWVLSLLFGLLGRRFLLMKCCSPS